MLFTTVFVSGDISPTASGLEDTRRTAPPGDEDGRVVVGVVVVVQDVLALLPDAEVL